MKLRVSIAVALCASAGAVRPLAAQQPPPATRDSTARPLEPVVVTGGRTATTVGGASAVVVTLDSLPMPVPPAPSLDRVLRQVPFLLLRQNSRGEVELSVRGSDSRQAAVLLDGLPLTLGWDHRSDPSLIPGTGIRSVRVVRGLSTLLQGPNVLGGVVELTLGSGGAPERMLPAVQFGTGIDETAARSVTGGGVLPLQTGAGTLVVRAGGAYRSRQGYTLSREVARGGLGVGDLGDEDAGELRTNSDLRQVDAYTTVRLENGSGAHVGVTASGYRAQRGVPPELHLGAPRYWRYPEVSRILTVLSAGTGAVATPLGAARFNASAGLNDGDTEIESYDDRRYGSVVGREWGTERTGTARAAAALAIGGGGELRVAGTAAGVRYDERLDDDPTSRYRQRLTSVGTELELPVAGRSVVSGGVVYDRVTNPETGGKPALAALDAWGWRLGATSLAFSGLVRMHASASRRSRFPALRELYSGALDRFEPNPGLRPERLLGAEVGATVAGGAAARAGFDLQAVAFHHRLSDAVVRVSAADRKFRRINRDQLRTTGLELLAGWSAERGGGPAGLSVTGDLTVQHVRVLDRTLADSTASERRAEHQPEQRASLIASVPLPLAIRGIASARYVGRQYCVNPDLERQVALGGRGAGDVGLLREFRLARSAGALLRSLRATIGLDNVTDAAVYDQCGLPQPGRTLRFAFEVR